MPATPAPAVPLPAPISSRGEAPTPVARRASRRALVSVFWAMLVGNLLIVAFIYRISAENDRSRAFEELQAIARHQAAISRWRLDQRDERQNATDDSEPITAVLRQQATPELSRRALATLHRQALARGDREVALLAADGTSLLSTVFPATVHPLTRQQLRAIARHGERQMLGVYLDGNGLPTSDVVTPVFVDQTRLLGFLVRKVDLSGSLSEILAQWAGRAKSGRASLIFATLTPPRMLSSPPRESRAAGVFPPLAQDDPALQRAAGSAATLFDRDLRLRFHNKKYQTLLDFPDDLFKEAVPNFETFARYNAWRGEYGPGDPEVITAEYLQRAQEPIAHVFERERPDGTTIEVRGAPLKGGGFVTIYTDITARKQAEQRQQLSEKIIATSPTAILITNPRNRIVFVNPAFSSITGFSFADVEGKDPKMFASGRHDKNFYTQFWRTLGHEDHWSGEIWDRRRDGSIYPKWLSVYTLRSAEGRLTNYVAMFTDITERKQAEQRIHHLAHHDEQQRDLARWKHPSSGMVGPDRFIPIAEETGLIVDIGAWVLTEGCRQARQWLDAGFAIRMSINLSARQLRSDNLLPLIERTLAEYRLPNRALELEITESAPMERPDQAVGILKAIKAMGVALALDDFGTGYSSLSYLKRFPIDRLKIDRSFVRDIETDPNDRAIALSTIALAHSLGLEVTAEGVEEAAQRDFLRQHGCDDAQGWFYSKAVPASAAEALLRKGFLP